MTDAPEEFANYTVQGICDGCGRLRKIRLYATETGTLHDA